MNCDREVRAPRIVLATTKPGQLVDDLFAWGLTCPRPGPTLAAMARITATEMVGVPFTVKEAQRLLDALAEGKLGPPDDADNVTLRKKVTVLLQVAVAAERRRASLPRR